jgi:nucleotide-binding universal stress UspA family protein
MRALDQAVRLHESGGGRLTVLHVAPWPMVFAGHGAAWVPDPAIILAGAREWLDGVVASHPGTEAVLLEGYPPAAACDWAADAGVDLMVASSSRGLFDRVLLGSFAGYLARHAPCAVLLTRPGGVTNSVGAKEDAERGSVE